MKWENIASDPITERLKVPGGWLVYIAVSAIAWSDRDDGHHRPGGFGITMTFVPDPTHAWVLE